MSEGLADVLEPGAQDFAFAETVHVSDLGEEPAPPSGPIIVNDHTGSHCVTPLAFPLPEAAAQVDLRTTLRVLWARARHGVRGALEEIADLWEQTEELVEVDTLRRGPGHLPPALASLLSRALVTTRRLRALWSFWQWDRTDLLRAGVIGIAVFLAAATIGATAMERRASAAASDEVRAPRTLEQHTPSAGHALVKARAASR